MRIKWAVMRDAAVGEGIDNLRTKHRANGTQLLGAELLGHTLQVRLRPSQLAAPDAPLDLVIGTRVVLRSLTGAAMNDEPASSPARSGRRRRGRADQGGSSLLAVKAVCDT